MTVSLKSTPQLRAAWALHKARQSRHHRDCRCGTFGGRWCNPDDEMWTRVMDKELEQLQR